MTKTTWRNLVGCAMLGAMPTLAAPVSGYAVEGKIHLAGNQGWDLLAVDVLVCLARVFRGQIAL